MDLYDDTSSDDADENEDLVPIALAAASTILKERGLKPLRIVSYIERVVSGYTNRQFQQSFRISRLAYEFLLQKLSPMLCSSPRKKPTVPVETQLLAVIWLLATPECYR